MEIVTPLELVNVLLNLATGGLMIQLLQPLGQDVLATGQLYTEFNHLLTVFVLPAQLMIILEVETVF